MERLGGWWESGRSTVGLPDVGQEMIEAALAPTGGELVENVGEIGQWRETVEGGRTHEAVERSGAVSATVRTGEEIVGSSDCYVTDLAFAEIVVEAESAVVEEASECRPLVEDVAGSLSECAARRFEAARGDEPLFEGVELGR